MLRLFSRLHFAYLGLFLIACGGIFAYQALYVWPIERCEAQGLWWDPQDHICATPIPIWRITGRRPDAGAASRPASARGAGRP